MRYKAIKDSDHGCCMEASVVDLTTYDDKEYNRPNNIYAYYRVCECFNMETAEKIAAALNEMENKK